MPKNPFQILEFGAESQGIGLTEERGSSSSEAVVQKAAAGMAARSVMILIERCPLTFLSHVNCFPDFFS